MTTLKLLYDDFINRPDIRAKTALSYKYDLLPFIRWVGEDKLIADVHPVDVMRYFQQLAKKPSIKSPVTYNKHLKSVRAFFRFAVDLRLIDKTPVTVKAQRVPRNRESQKAMPDAKLNRLIDYTVETVRGWNPREEALVRFLADTGCRIGSAAALRWSDVNFDECSAVLWHQKARDEPLKVVFGMPCKRALMAWKLRQGGGKVVFSSSGREMDGEHLGQYFRRLCQRAGVGSWGPHSLRHRFGRVAIKKFGPVITAQMMGDSPEIVMKFYGDESAAHVLDLMRHMATGAYQTDKNGENVADENTGIV